MAKSIETQKTSRERAMATIASLKFWSRIKNPPSKLVYAFPALADYDDEELDRLIRIPSVRFDASAVFSLRFSLVGARPPVWRRILTRSISLEVLNHIIQLMMGWSDRHLHGFEIRKSRVPLVEDGEEIDEREISIGQLFAAKIKRFHYTYDFDENWRHSISIEKWTSEDSETSYPLCIEGRGTCPLEDVGGMERWRELLDAFQHPEREYCEEIEQLLDHFSPDDLPAPFNLDVTNTRLRLAFHKRSRRNGRA